MDRLKVKLEKAGRIRRDYHPPVIGLVYPQETAAVSITGEWCSLNCAHCGGHYLRHMLPLKEVLRKQIPPRSYLLSGGCTPAGTVPHLDYREELAELADRAPLNLHPGLVGEDEARLLGQLAQVLSFDLVVDDSTVKEVYGKHLSGKHFISTYRVLRRYGRVVPHLCLGLHGGRISGEYKTLEVLQKEGAEAITFLVLRPTAGTIYARCSPPPPEEVGDLLAEARIKFPRIPIYLGCLRPGGSYRMQLDPLAVRAGVNRLVHPAPTAFEALWEMGLAREERKECCVL